MFLCGCQDQNLGLVTLVEQSLRRRIIQKLTQTWSTLSLGQLTNLLGMDEKVESQVEAVESEVLGMVSFPLSLSLPPGVNPSLP